MKDCQHVINKYTITADFDTFEEEDGSIIVDLTCVKCGLSWSLRISSDEVNW